MSLNKVPDSMLVNPGGGGGTPTVVEYDVAIDLSVAGSGTVMPQQIITQTTVFTIATGATNEGSCAIDLIGDGTHTIDVSNFTNVNGGTFDNTLNARTTVVFGYKGSPVVDPGYGVCFIFPGGPAYTAPVQPSGPVFTSQSAPAATTGGSYSYRFVASTADVNPAFAPMSTPGGSLGNSYTYQYVGGTPPVYAVTSGALPTGVSLDPITGIVSGTPSAAGTYTFVITAYDGIGSTPSTTQTVIVGAGAPPSFTAQSPPGDTQGTPYSYQYAA